MKSYIMAGLIFLSSAAAVGLAGPTTEPSTVVPLWPGGAPGQTGSDPVKDVPTLSLFPAPADKATGAAVVICPGGGYGHLAAHEGKDYALWLNQQGITGLVLKYRLGSNGYRHPSMMLDVQRALRLTRARAEEWKIDPKKVGVMGSSAGGHLAATAMTHYDAGQPDAADPVDRQNCRPDIGILCYAVISMGPLSHSGSKANLLGPTPTPELIELLSNEKQVTAETPPCFIWHTFEDKGVKVENALAFAGALADKKVPFDLHVYQHGGHGLGLGVRNYDPSVTDPAKLLPWTQDLLVWLKLQQFTPLIVLGWSICVGRGR